MPNYYPIMLDVRSRRAIVVGGDRIAAEKASGLVASGAQVEMLNETFCDEILAMAKQGKVTLRQKAYKHGDLAGAFVVVAATHEPTLVKAIWSETQERNQLVNIV
ncbi:MAG TPA: siroheme synthase, partial [Ktedonobacter sp.]|nr:siroheme synthase [Ktedonobacter sp.]